MGEAKEKKAAVTLVTATARERLAIAQLLDGQKTKGYDDRQRRRRVREAFGILPDVNVWKRTVPVPNGYMEHWTMGRKVGDNGAQDAKFIAKRSVEITGEIVDYLIKLTTDHEVPDSSSETLLDVEDMLHAVKAGSFKSPDEGEYPGIDEESDDDKWKGVIDNEA